MKAEYAQIALSSLLLSSAPPDIAEALFAQARVQNTPHGTMIFAQDDPAEAIYVVVRGWVKLYRVAASGSEAVVGVFTRGQSFGEAVALRGGRYPVYAEAVSDAVLLRIDARTLLGLLKDSPEVAISMLTATYAHLHNLVAQIEQLKAQTGPQRVADFLLGLTEIASGACAVELPYDKVLIAGHLGMKPESLSRAFAKLRAQGVTVSQHSAKIADIAALRAYAEQDRADAWQARHDREGL